MHSHYNMKLSETQLQCHPGQKEVLWGTRTEGVRIIKMEIIIQRRVMKWNIELQVEFNIKFNSLEFLINNRH